jgi:UPF0042 nucleotide-binding protein
MSIPASTMVIAGLTGAGKTAAVQQLETLGFAGFESLPAAVLAQIYPQLQEYHARLAIVLDLRQPALIQQTKDIWPFLQESQCPLVFLEASDAILIQRISAHRRHHPYADQRGLVEAIQWERSLLASLRAHSTAVIDTSALTVHQLRQQLQEVMNGQRGPHRLTLLSFGFKYGLPLDANLLFDVRFLPNPYFIPQLRLSTGLDPNLQAFLFEETITRSTFDRITLLVQEWLPAYLQEHRPLVTVAIGCTGGQHRSVALVERLAAHLQQDPQIAKDWVVQVEHRHLSTSQQELARHHAAETATDPPDSQNLSQTGTGGVEGAPSHA